MTTPWFLQGAIICVIIHSMGKYGEAIIEIKHAGDDDYFEEFNLSKTSNDEKAFKRLNDQVKHFLIKENERGANRPPENDQGPRRYFYQKYMKIGNSKTTTLPDNNKEAFEQKDMHKNKILSKSSKIHQQNKAEKVVEAFHNLAAGNAKDNSKGKTQMTHVTTLQTIKNYYNSMYHTNLSNLQHKVSKQNENNHNYNNRRLMAFNRHILNLNKKKAEKNFNNENRSSHEWHKKLERRRKSSGIRNQKLMYKDNKPGTIKIPFYLENVAKGRKTFEGIIKQPPAEHRRVRSCELRMEDMRESYMPNEQLSIYHPKMSMTDQFVLSDTMF